ncbi:DUF4398 domain-containing protein [Cellvibrio sp. PSBB006]|uniref:DUF4398 domain-containing protein n=1 Tax=Cellvibrio sp. PSBB006 TaxID=1987723 RepID=UPI000B3B7EA0|nr:DUF4398 domain-containing protein [Cellvibrio sp. PSBB006]ARU27042.1 hypothetical protein CBR65_06085 [Cellvibrio sp. PSBB006]
MIITKINSPNIDGVPSRRPAGKSSFLVASLVGGLLMVAACSTTPKPPSQALQMAELAIANAEQARVADYSSLELSEAREKLAAARMAVQNEDMVLAQRLAVESALDAELATAKAATARAQIVNDDMQESTQTLKQEMNRNTGVRK